MMYSFHGNEDDAEKLIVYSGLNPRKEKKVFGMVLMKEQMFTSSEFEMVEQKKEEMEMLVPYLISFHILHDVAKVKGGEKLLMLPPIDTVAIYILALAEKLGCKIFSSSWDVEVHQMMIDVFPSVHCLEAKSLARNVSDLTQGTLCDVCIQLTGKDLNDAIEMVAEHGTFVQCIPPPQDKAVEMNMMVKNNMITLLEPINAMKEFFNKDEEEQKQVLHNIGCDGIAKLYDEGFPEASGILYRRDETVNFSTPIKLKKLLNLLEDTDFGSDTAICTDMLEVDSSALKRLQNMMTDKPKDYSIAELETMDSDSSELNTVNSLNIGMSQTPTNTWDSFKLLEFQTPDVKIVSVKEISPTKKTKRFVDDCNTPHNLKARHGNFGNLPSSTPVITILLSKDNTDNKLDVQDEANELSFKKKASKIVSNLDLLKSNRVDLLLCGRPPTPMTPSIRELLTPKFFEPNVIPLNDLSHDGRPLFIIHPISGNLILLEKLGKLVHTRCYGIKRTTVTPKDSIENIARYYINGMEMFDASGPYRIAGYSYGATIAFEMACQLQANRKEVESLILFDGSPEYFHKQIAQGQQSAPAGASQRQLDDYIEVGSLLEFMRLYYPIGQEQLLHSVLMKLPTLETKIQMAVDITTGHVLVSSNPRSHWQKVQEKVINKPVTLQNNDQKPKLFGTAMEVIRMKRKQKAEDFINSVHVVNHYLPAQDGKKFNGDIHLLRIKSELPHCQLMSTDYGLQSLCTGKVYIQFYNGDHESFINRDEVQTVARDVNYILASLSAG
ncbi:hypothetical protein ScPMuIL_000787 [Solemya velum]